MRMSATPRGKAPCAPSIRTPRGAGVAPLPWLVRPPSLAQRRAAWAPVADWRVRNRLAPARLHGARGQRRPRERNRVRRGDRRHRDDPPVGAVACRTRPAAGARRRWRSPRGSTNPARFCLPECCVTAHAFLHHDPFRDGDAMTQGARPAHDEYRYRFRRIVPRSLDGDGRTTGERYLAIPPPRCSR